MGGMIGAVSKKTTKTGQSMAIITVEDVYGSIEAVMFPKVFDKYKDRLELEAIVEISGKLQIRDGERPNIVLDKIEILQEEEPETNETAMQNPYEFSSPFTQKAEEVVKPKKKFLVVILNGADAECREDVLEILTSYPGDIPAYLKIDGKTYSANYSCRESKGLFHELCTLIDGENVKFIEK